MLLGGAPLGSLAISENAPVDVVLAPLIFIRRATVRLQSPQIMRDVVSAGSTLTFLAQFYDNEYQPIAPDSVTWNLLAGRRLIYGGIVEPADESTTITIPAQYVGAGPYFEPNEGEQRLDVTANYNSAVDAITASCKFRVRRFQ